jgi:hypothetical protein
MGKVHDVYLNQDGIVSFKYDKDLKGLELMKALSEYCYELKVEVETLRLNSLNICKVKNTIKQ